MYSRLRNSTSAINTLYESVTKPNPKHLLSDPSVFNPVINPYTKSVINPYSKQVLNPFANSRPLVSSYSNLVEGYGDNRKFLDVYGPWFKNALSDECILNIPEELTAPSSGFAIIHNDARLGKEELRYKFAKIGTIARAINGSVLYAKYATVSFDKLIPKYDSTVIDITLAELLAFNYGILCGIDYGLEAFDMITDNMSCKNFMIKKEIDMKRKSHKFAVICAKKIWFESLESGYGRIAWIPGEENYCADYLSRWLPRYEKTLLRKIVLDCETFEADISAVFSDNERVFRSANLDDYASEILSTIT